MSGLRVATENCLLRLADEIDSQAAISSRHGQMYDLERIATQLRAERDRIHASGVQEMVREFHEVFGVAIGQAPTRDIRTLRARLIAEEANEATAALGCSGLGSIAQELADLVYVTYGTAVSLGIDLDAAVAEVHRANMSKLDPDGRPLLRSDGKVLKGPNYRPPDMRSALPTDGH